MRIGLLRKTLVPLSSCAAATAVHPAAAAPEVLRAYNAPVSESSTSGVSSGGYMAVQFGTAWSSVIRGVGIVAGGPYWCAKADSNDFITWYWGPIFRATGSCMKGPRIQPERERFHRKGQRQGVRRRHRPRPKSEPGRRSIFFTATTTSLSRGRQPTPLRVSTATTSALRTAATCSTKRRSGPVTRTSFCQSRAPSASIAATTMTPRTSTSATTTRPDSKHT